MARKLGMTAAIALVAAAAMLAVPAQAGTGRPPSPHASSELAPRIVAGAAHGLVRPHRAKAPTASARRSPLMTNHGGVIMTKSLVKAIFWGTTWNPLSVDDKIAGIDSFYGGFGGSNYAKTNTEYTGNNGPVGPDSTYQGHVVDNSAASGGGNTSAILAEVANQVKLGNIVIDETEGNNYVPVYTDLPRGNAGYCAWHSAGTINGHRVQFAFFWKLDSDPGCDPQDATTGHSKGLAALGNVSAHELSEAMTDPASPGAWYDGSGAENGDKCAWTFGAASVPFKNGTSRKVQGEWSNKAYTAGTGYPNSSGQKGCLGGL